MIRVCLPVGSDFGWGIAGKNIVSELAALTEIGSLEDPTLPLLMAISGPDFTPLRNFRADHRQKTVGYAFIETPSVAHEHVVKAASLYNTVVCGSSWMRFKMEQLGLKAGVAFQGVDYDIFKPASEALPAHPFTVFIGAKFELRKGQDIALAAMKIFMKRHPETRLIAAVGNHWPETMRSMESSPHIDFQYLDGVPWKDQVANCLAHNGICLNKVTLPDIKDHLEMAALYKRAHVGLFPNRCEAGTNLVMCEAIACGIPVIANAQTGHADVSECIPLELAEGHTTDPDGWFEQDSIEEIVDNLELAYSNPTYYRGLGLAAAETIKEKLSWSGCAKAILGYLNETV
jgi:glycosyltransferase involved in cell wall biosynthesis